MEQSSEQNLCQPRPALMFSFGDDKYNLRKDHQSHCGFGVLFSIELFKVQKRRFSYIFFPRMQLHSGQVVCRQAEEARLIAWYYTKIKFFFCWKNITDFNSDHNYTKITLPLFKILAFRYFILNYEYVLLHIVLKFDIVKTNILSI